MSMPAARRSILHVQRTPLAAGLIVTLLVAGCRQSDVPRPQPAVESRTAEDASATAATEPGATSDPIASESATAPDAPKRKGTRVVGGLPPIRRADLVSGLAIPGAQRFYLGGGQPSSFYCDVENQGDTEVLISATRGSGATVIARLHPGDSASHRFQPTEAAVLANLSPLEPAKLRVRIWGDTNLQMRYEPDQP